MSWTVWVIIIERTLMLIQHFSVIKKVKFFGSLVLLTLILSACATPAGDAKDVKNKTSMNPGRELGLDQEQKSAAQASGQKSAHSALSSSAFANVRSALDGAQVNELSDKVSSSLTQTAINKTEDLINQKANEVVNSKGHGKTQVSLRQQETKNPQFSIKTIQPLSDLTDTSTQLTFTQAQISSGENHGERRATINLGIGQRYLLEDGQAVAGINLFTDYETESKHSRASLGLEYQRANFSANANKYHPLSSKVVIGDYTEEPLAGYDIRLTGQMPYLPWARIKGTQYYWDAVTGEDIKGTRLGIEADINASTTLEVGTENSNTANRSAYATLRVQLPYSANPTSARLKLADKAFEDSGGISLTDLNYVERSNKIRVEKLLNGVSVLLAEHNAATSGATCTLKNALGVPVANGAGVTGPDGSVTLSNVVLTSGLVTALCTGGTYVDEATGVRTPAPNIRSAIIYSGAGDLTMVLTPLSEIAYQMADTNAGTALASTITAKNAEVATASGLNGIDIIITIPTDINNVPAANDAAGMFGTVLAAISQMVENAGDASPTATIEALVGDMLGTDSSAVGTIEGRNSVDIATAINNFETGSGVNDGTGAGNISSSVGEGTIKGNAAIAFIDAYDGTNTAPTLQYYIDAGVTSVTVDNIAAVNAAVSGQTAGTTAQIQALVDAIKIISISDQSRSIAENSADTTTVGAVLVTTGSPTGFSIASGNTNDAFAISSTGQITVADSGELDYETTPSYTLVVEITKADTTTQSADITLNVTNVNEGVVIGTQTWSESNMSLVPTAFNSLGTDYWTAYDGTDGSGDATDEDGYYYTWDAAMNVCPSGWRLPSDRDWKVLEGHLGMTDTQQNLIGWRGTDEGTKLKVSGSSGFEAKLAGIRGANGFFGRGDYMHLWSSTQSGNRNAYRRYLRSSYATIYRSAQGKTNGLSVRCLKD